MLEIEGKHGRNSSQSNVEMLNELRRDIDNLLMSSINMDESINHKPSHFGNQFTQSNKKSYNRKE